MYKYVIPSRPCKRPRTARTGLTASVIAVTPARRRNQLLREWEVLFMKIKRFAAGLLVLAMLLTTLPTDLAVRAESFSDWYQLMPAGSQYHTVTFTAQGQEVYTAFIADGGTVSGVPSAPRVSGMAFIGWCYEGRLFSASTPVTADMVIEAAYSAVDSALELQKQIAPYSQSAAGAYASLTVFGTPKKNHTPSLRALTGVAGTDSAAVLEAWTVDNLHKRSSITLEAVVTNRPELGRGQTLAAYAVRNGKLGSIIQSTLSVGSRVVVTLLPGSMEGIALVRLTSALSEDETVPGTDPSAPSEEEDEEEDDQLQDGVLWANDDLYITGRIPGNGVIDVTPVDIEINGQKALAAWDIKIYANQKQREKGKTWQPAGEKVHVYVRSSSFGNRKVRVYHIPDAPLETRSLLKAAPAAPQTELVAETTAQDGWVAFDAGSFSIYAVVDPGSTEDNARVAVNFWNGENKVATIYVKNSDTGDDLDTILYDPGIGKDVTLGENEIFLGWTTNKDYTASQADRDAAVTIDKIREYIDKTKFAEGDTVDYYAMILKNFTINYLDPDGISMGTHSIYITTDQTQADYQITMTYTPTDNQHNFEGWLVTEETKNHISASDPAADDIQVYIDDQEVTRTRYQFEANLTITGNVEFNVNAPEGEWLIFNENGKGARYNAPQFVKRGDHVVEPSTATAEEMTRTGYTFGGWYTKLAEGATPDEHGYTAVDESSLFQFQNQELNEYTVLYAKWTPVRRAPYTIIFWTQNYARDGYDLKEVYVPSEANYGTVGQNIPYSSIDNGDEDYVRLRVSNQNTDYHYTGFCLTDASKNQQIKVTPEGDAVLNLYFDRIVYNLKFIMYRKTHYSDNYSYANGSNNGKNLWDIADWTNVGQNTTLPRTTYGNGRLQSERINDNTGDYDAYYFTLQAYYGEDISSRWPQYSELIGPNNDGTKAVSFVMMNGTRLKENGLNDNGYGTGKDTIKGQITVMDDGILAKTNDANGNYLIIRYAGYNNWTYHIYYEADPNKTYPPNTQFRTVTINGVTKTYYFDHDVTSRSSNTIPGNQNPPSYMGYEVATTGQGNNKTVYYDSYGGNAPSPTNTTGYTVYLNYYYNRLAYPITYLDGSYRNGDDGEIKNVSDLNQVLGETGNSDYAELGPDIGYEFVIPDACKNYVPEPREQGFVFEGWYADAACNIPYDFTTMPMGGIIVYAKWRQIQYRVLLHANDGTRDENGVNWGSDSVSMSFRIPYGDKISLPNGTRFTSGYELVGWFKDPNYTKAFSGDTRIIYDENNPNAASNDIFSDYIKTHPDHATDPIDIWGDYADGQRTNTDINRFWITKRVDLYAQWRKIVPGAPGIIVEYDANGGTFSDASEIYTDPKRYVDSADATTLPGPANPPTVDMELADGTTLEDKPMVFLYWVVQEWDQAAGKYKDVAPFDKVYPGDTFKVLLDNSKKIVTKWGNPNDGTDVIEVSNPAPGTTPPDSTHTVIKEATYTVRLRAEYKMPENPTPTHIWWFPNYPDITQPQNVPDKHNKVYVDGTTANDKTADRMGINEAVYIKTPDSTDATTATSFHIPAGYTFLGWARVDEDKSKSLTNTNNAGNIDNVNPQMFLYYHPADGKKGTNDKPYYTTDADGNNVVSYVAADESDPIHDLYAMWTKLEVTKKVDGVSADDKAHLTDDYSQLVSNKNFKFVIQHPNGRYFVTGSGFTATTIANATKFDMQAGSALNTAGAAATVAGLGNGKYKFIEIRDDAALTGYTLESSGSNDCVTEVDNVHLNGSASRVTVEFKNVYTRDKGTLRVTKVTAPDGIAADHEYHVRISTTANGQTKYVTDTNGTLSATAPTTDLTVSPGTPLVITNLPTGTYTVEEILGTSEEEHAYVDVDGYQFNNRSYSPTGGSVMVAKTNTASNPAVVTITNSYTRLVDVTVTKAFTGITALPAGFKITATYGSNSTEFTVNSTGMTGTGASDNPYTWTLEGVPVGTEITFTESGHDTDAHYSVSTTAGGANATSGTLTASETADDNAFAFVNTYTQLTVDLNIAKLVTGNMADTSKAFAFTAVLSGTDPVVFGAGDGYTLSNENKTATFSLSHNGTVTLQDVPIGATVTITETPDGYTPTVTSDRTGTATTNANGVYAFTVASDDAGKTITFTNELSQTPDTGIRMDTIPYLLILAVCALGLAALRRRRAKGGM